MGRKKLADEARRNKPVQFNLTADEHVRALASAESKGRKLADYARALVLGDELPDASK